MQTFRTSLILFQLCNIVKCQTGSGGNLNSSDTFPPPVATIATISKNTTGKLETPLRSPPLAAINGQAGFAHDLAQCSCGRTNFGSGKIVGGTSVVEGEGNLWPWFATVVRSDHQTGPVHCGGSLISKRYVITAAHCLVTMIQFGLRHFRVKLGYNDLKLNDSRRGLTLPIESVTVHPRFEQSYPYFHDIGIIKLVHAVNCTKTIHPICLPSQSDGDFEGESAITAGFGRESFGGNQSSILKQIKISVISLEECRNRFMNLSFKGPDIVESMLCAWGKDRDTCVGDSGGPLFLQQKNSSTYIQIGITSWGIGCASERFPGVYTRLTAYVPWISSVVTDYIN